MKFRGTTRNVSVFIALCTAQPVWAAVQGSGSRLGGWVLALLAIGAAVVLSQAMPAVVLMGSMLRELFGRSTQNVGDRREIS